MHARRWISESLAADRPIVRIVPVRAYQQRATGTGNPANPDPTKNVRWGQQTYDEMMIGYLEHYTPLNPTVAGGE